VTQRLQMVAEQAVRRLSALLQICKGAKAQGTKDPSLSGHGSIKALFNCGHVTEVTRLTIYHCPLRRGNRLVENLFSDSSLAGWSEPERLPVRHPVLCRRRAVSDLLYHDQRRMLLRLSFGRLSTAMTWYFLLLVQHHPVRVGLLLEQVLGNGFCGWKPLPLTMLIFIIVPRDWTSTAIHLRRQKRFASLPKKGPLPRVLGGCSLRISSLSP
jgi:hypothetical protein